MEKITNYEEPNVNFFLLSSEDIILVSDPNEGEIIPSPKYPPNE